MSRIVPVAVAATVALALSGQAFAQPDATAQPPATPPSAAAPAAQSASDGSTVVFSPATPEAKPMLPAEDVAIAEKLRTLIETKLASYVPRKDDRAGVEAFYRARSFAPLWIEKGSVQPRAADAAAYLKTVEADGLDPADYPVPKFADASPDARATDELMLTNSVLAFARHARTGRVSFTRVSGSIWFDLKFPEPAGVLNDIASSSNIRATLESFHPQQPGYKALKTALADERGRADAGNAKAQASRIDAILANIERWRWLPRDLGAAHVIVNVPDFTLTVMDGGKPKWTTRIVTGKPGQQATPLLSETMKYITVNPTWNVPPSIIRNEYLPALARDSGALARIGLQVGRNKDGSVRIFQPPGEKNALGRIRFNFPNRFLVYQHDTPQKHLFQQAARAYSHGCMRVQNPDQYAEVLLSVSQPEDNYSADRVRKMYGSGERSIIFKNPIPVHITYQTVFVDAAGQLQTRADVYGLDKEIANQLHNNRRIADVAIARNYHSSAKPVMATLPTAPSTRARTAANEAESSSRSWNSGGGLFDFFQNRVSTW